MGVALVGCSMPIFWWGLLLIILFSGILQWTPVSGRISLMYFFPPVTGFMLIDSLLSGQKGAFISALSHLALRSEEHTSELQSLMRISYAVFCLKKKKIEDNTT